MTKLLAATLLGVLLSACAVYVTPEPSTAVRVRPIPSPSQPEITVTDLAEIETFAPTRGERAVYDLGEEIEFRVRTGGDGYLTLTVYGPDGATSVIAQDVYVRGGVDTYLPTPESGMTYTLAPPRGLQRVSAILSSSPGSADVLDTAETSFYIE